MTTDAAIHVRGLEKSYKKLAVLRGVDFDVPRGSIFALLGSNGAGKTTVVKILSTLLRADAGTVSVNGFDVATLAADVRESISLTGQFAAVDEILSGRENLVLVAKLRQLEDPGAIADDLLERFRLHDAADRPVKTYSGGMRRRLDLAAALVHRPPVLFLDEPTTGLDPQGRIEVWQAVKELAAGGTTVLLTTQYLEEADQLADRIVVIDRGKVIAEGTPLELKDQSGRAALVITVSKGEDLPIAERMLRDHVDEVHVDPGARQLTAPANGLADMTRIAGIFASSDIELDDLGLKRPSLDDVFLHLTGHRAEETRAEDATGSKEEVA